MEWMLGGYVDAGQNTLAFASSNNLLCFNFNVAYQLFMSCNLKGSCGFSKYCNSYHFDGIQLGGVQS